MKAPLLFPFALLFASCQDDQTDSSQNDSNSSSEESTITSSSHTDTNEKRTITPSNRRNVVDRAKIASAKTCASLLVQACDSFFEEYQALPLSGTSAIDTSQETDRFFMATLLGLRSAEDDNPKLVTFFEFKSTTTDEKEDGILRTADSAELFDPWGNHYNLFLNYDYDNRLRPLVTGEVIFDHRVLVWSNGPDGKSGTPETNADNVYSWNAK